MNSMLPIDFISSIHKVMHITKKDAPSLLYITQHNLINFPIPKDCRLIQRKERILPFSKNLLIMGRLFSYY
jgi:hypothetical protein